MKSKSNTKAIGKYGVTFSDNQFKLLSTKTQCLAEEKCGIPSFNLVKEKVSRAVVLAVAAVKLWEDCKVFSNT